MKEIIYASRGDALIGIWWYTDEGQVWGKCCPVDDGELDGMYLQLSRSKNHMTLWSSTVKDNVEDVEDQRSIIALGYRSLERGRVIYNTATQCYEVTCSKNIVDDEEFRKAIISYFQLSGNRVDFVPLNHYFKIELTGNPAVDSYIGSL